MHRATAVYHASIMIIVIAFSYDCIFTSGVFDSCSLSVMLEACRYATERLTLGFYINTAAAAAAAAATATATATAYRA